MEKIPVSILGATGTVGQRFVQLLDGHPWFKVVALTGSERSEGQRYQEACHWVLSEPIPNWAASLKLLPSDPDLIKVPLVFSALPTPAAQEIEPQFSRAGCMVCTNASAFRMEEDVPILMPEVNPDHTSLIPIQRNQRNWSGGIVTNSNCTSAGLTIVLSALARRFGVKRAIAVSLQALSGAGYPGIASLDIVDNVIPYVDSEEEKVEFEPRKMLGSIENGRVVPADFLLSAHTNRVQVSDGHLVCLSVELDRQGTIDDVAQSLEGYRLPAESSELPSSPKPVILLKWEQDRPQPKLDRMAGRGMTTVVGRLRPDPILGFKLVILSHNTIRGAAGGSIYNAELLHKQGWF